MFDENTEFPPPPEMVMVGNEEVGAIAEPWSMQSNAVRVPAPVKVVTAAAL